MIYQVFCYDNLCTFLDDTINANAKIEAENLLKENQELALSSQSTRFSICATFVENNNTTWREIKDTDPEDTICQVFDTFTGTYTQVNSKTEAYALNEIRKQEYLKSIFLDKVYELDVIPVPEQPTITGVDTLPT